MSARDPVAGAPAASEEAVDYDPFSGGALARAVPTTEAQREVWLADRLGREASLAYNESVTLRFRGALDADALRAAVQDLVDRHDALRGTFSADGETLHVLAALALEVPLVDHRDAGPGAADALAEARRRVVEAPFDLEAGPLFRAELHRLADEEHALILTAHHIVCDGWSFGVLVHDLGRSYASRVGAGAAPPPPAASFADYAIAQAASLGTQEDRAAEAFWLSRFAGALPVLDLPLDRPRPAWRSLASRREDHVLEADLVAQARKLGATRGAGLFATLLGTFAVLLERLGGGQDVVVGVPSAGQSAAGQGDLVGHCVNLLPLRLEVAPAGEAAELVGRVQTALLDANEHQGYTYGTLLRKLPVARDASRLPLVSVMFNLDQALDANEAGFPGVDAGLASNPRAFENFELFVNAVQCGGALRLECQYNADLFDADTIRRWLACYETLLRSACAAPGTPVGRLAMVPAGDLERLARWNDTAAPFSRDSLAHELFERQAARAPEKPAVRFAGRRLTYGQLEAMANRIARGLRLCGVKTGDLVGLNVRRGVDMLAAVLGVLKSGAAYVPLDPGFPAERLRFMAEDAGLRVLVTEAALEGAIDFAPERTLRLDADAAQLAALPAEPPEIDGEAATPASIAYVIYTSGSTGKPKGVRVPHRGVVNFLESMAREPGLAAGDRVVAVTTLSFDIAVNELLLPLSVGAEVVLASACEAGDGVLLAGLLAESEATLLQATPATWRLLLAAGWKGSRELRALCGGEALGADLARELLPRLRELWNLYGPTETTVWSTCARIADANAPVGIGHPIANTTVWILDEHRQACPIGVPGEIWIGGEGVTAGYLGRPELTAERFVADPFGTAPGARLYGTGDRGRWREDGSLEHLGRLDHQLKVRGYRIEPGEIEATLAGHPGIAQALVVTREDLPGDVRLVAYVVPRGPAPADDALRECLRACLPDYMVPSHFVALAALPLLPNGKIDRRALPAPLAAPARAAAFEAPQSALEKQVAAAMESLLALPGLARDDGFFALGGHSLLAAQLAARLAKELGRPVPLRAIFDAPTVRALAAWIESHREVAAADGGKIPARADRASAPLSAMQHRIWFLEQLDPGRAVYNTPSAHRLRGRLDEAAFARAFADVVARQEALRTGIDVVDGQPVQVILPPGPVELPGEDLRDIPAQTREAVLHERLEALAAEPFDLGEAPLFRARLFRLRDEEYAFYFCAHHIVWDGWSFDILYREMAALYAAHLEGREAPLAPLATHHGDFTAWHRDWMAGEEAGAELAHWKSALAGTLEPLAVPTDRPRPPDMSGQGATTWVSLPVDTVRAVRELGRHEGATPFMVLLAGYVLLLHRLTGQAEFVVGVPVRGRPTPDLERIMGLFVNVLPLRLRVDPAAPFARLVEEVRLRATLAFGHPDVPFEQLVRELKVPRDRSRFPVYQALFSFQDAGQRERRWGNVEHDMIHVMQPGIAEDLSLWLMERGDGIQGGLGYNTDILAPETAELLRRRFASGLDFVLRHPGTPLGDLPLAEEESQRLAGWNDTARPLPGESTVDALVSAQAAREPHRVAISQGASQASYAQLEARANRIARALRARGARRGAFVGLCLPRGIDLIAAQLAILKTGAAYVPLDPAYPAERLRYMADDAGLVAVVTQTTLAALCAAPGRALLCLDADAAQIDALPGEPWSPEEASARATDPAYVIYTSGSTGKPKGVVVPHRAVLNFLGSMRLEPGIAAGERLLAVTTLSFDIAVLELLLPLANGAQVILATNEEAADPAALAHLLEKSQATMMQATPGTWRMLLEAGWPGRPGLKALVGGEALAPDLAARLLPVVGELWNLYGPTETTVWSTCWRVADLESGIRIGRPIANTQVHVLDERRRPCPIGTAGEIWIGGAGVADGYLGRADLTRERFVDDPFRAQAGARLYRTGDRGRWRAEGQLEHLGRLDHQVKVRGYRIELGEIEAALLAHESIAQAVALAREASPGDVRLVAYCVAKGAEPAPGELRERLRGFLPAYMLPQSIRFLAAIPRLPNGKVDRAALPVPEDEPRAGAPAEAAPPDTPTEKQIAGIWATLLKAGDIRADDNFFDIGGHSLLAMQAILTMEKACGKRIDRNRYVFETLRQIARAYDEAVPAPASKPGAFRGMLSGLLRRGAPD